MLQNYLKITFRNLLKNKGYTSINILGLTLGIASALIITMVIKYELNFDKFHSNQDSLYRIVRHTSNASGESTKPNTTYPLAQALRTQFPNLEDNIAQIHSHEEDQVNVGEKRGFEKDIIFADPQFFRIFDFEVISGNPLEDLKDAGKVFITPTIARKYFGETSPIGQSLTLAGELELEVVGLLSENVANSHVKMNMVVSYASFNSSFTGGFPIDEWGVSMSGYSYVNLPNIEGKKPLQDALIALADAHINTDDGESTTFHLQPLDEIHFDKKYANSNFPAIDENYIFIMLCIGVFILVIACVNFINMSTALATKRAKEVGMRRTLGARKHELIAQFMGETFVIVLLALSLALALVERLLPYISTFLDKGLSLHLFTDWTILASILILLLVVTLAAGLYPSLVLANYQPIHALKMKLNNSKQKGSSLRVGLVTFQFVISQILIIATIIIAAQTDYFLNKPLGFNKDFIISIPLSERDSLKNQFLKQQVLKNSQIKSFSYAVGAPTSENNLSTSFTVDERSAEQSYDITLKTADEDYQKTYDIELLKGRWFGADDAYQNSRGISTKKALIVNETAVKEMGYDLDEAVGKYITIGINNISAPIVGVVKDFHTRSFHEKIESMVIIDMPRLYYQAGIKISSNNVPETLEFLESSWKQTYPEYIFQYDFLDEKIASNYKSEQRTFTMFKIFAGISIFICCIGLLGLVSFMVTSRTKEVGVRKVLGASVSSVLLLFSKDFITVIAIAFIIASPIVWYTLQNWLNNFAYHIDMQLSYYLIGFICTVVITILSIGIQSYKAAIANPVDALQDE